MENLTNEQEIIKLLFKDSLTDYNSHNISKLIKISPVGAFKILKKLEKRDIVKSKKVGKAVVYSLNRENLITNKEIEMALLLESQNFKRWVEEFKDLENKVKFLLLFGSIIKDVKKAKDIDILILVEKDKLNSVKKVIENIQKYTSKKIHPLIQTIDNFKRDVNEKNKVMSEIIKTGIVIYGQDEYIKTLNYMPKIS